MCGWRWRAWLWLLGDEKTLAYMDDPANDSPYGVKVLAEIERVYNAAGSQGAEA